MSAHTDRRAFVALLVGAAAAWPIGASAQQVERMRRIGVLNTSTDDAVAGGVGYPAFIAELQKLGFTEGQNLVIDYGRTDQGADKAFAEAAEMVRNNVAVILASGSELPLRAALAASPTVPIVVLANNYDPIALGYASSLARPGGNITGFTYRQTELAQKRVRAACGSLSRTRPTGPPVGCKRGGIIRRRRAHGEVAEPADSRGETGKSALRF